MFGLRLSTARKKIAAYREEYSHLSDGGLGYRLGFGAILIVAIPFLALDLLILMLFGKDVGWFPAVCPGKAGTAPASESTPKDAEEVWSLLEPLKKPALQMIAATAPGVFSKIGGSPEAPATLVWPRWRDRPLAFLAQLDLEELGPHRALDDLPESGRLYFFYDAEQETWGFSPDDRGSWSVVYVPTGRDVAPIVPPEDLVDHGRYAEKRVTFATIMTYPSPERLDIGPNNISLSDWDQIEERRAAPYGEQSQHQIGGLPQPVQGDAMETECQLAANGIDCGDGSAFTDPRIEALKAGAEEWRLLLQLDSDDDTGMMWGDCGQLYFWIRREDLENRDFSNTWMILQCC